MNSLSSLTARTLAIVVACAIYVALSGISGLAQQAPAPGAGAAPGQGQGQGRGRGQQQQGCAPSASRGGGALGEGPWEYGNGPNRYKVSVVTRAIDHPWGIAFVPGGDMTRQGVPGGVAAVHGPYPGTGPSPGRTPL